MNSLRDRVGLTGVKKVVEQVGVARSVTLDAAFGLLLPGT